MRAPSDDARWEAVCARDARSDGRFVFAVVTTGIFCRPSCGARRPLRRNVRFFESPQAAQFAGFRACRRCHPLEGLVERRHTALVTRVCRRLETADEAPTLAELGRLAGLSPFHLQRVFKAHTGLSPKQYALAVRAARVRVELGRAATVTEALYAAGYGASSRFYETAGSKLGASPREFREGRPEVRFTLVDSSLGRVLLAVTPRGLCQVSFGASDGPLERELAARFPSASRDDTALASWARDVVDTIDGDGNRELPLDIRGTVFQHRVWQAIARIPRGETRSYAELAASIGSPTSVRAVAQACGANRLAVFVPCHRVVGSRGAPGGYRWGSARKRRLLAKERRVGGRDRKRPRVVS